MSKSLKDQLLAAGLAKPKPAKKKKAKKKKAPTPPKAKRKQVSDSALRAQRAMLERAKQDKAREAKRQREAEKKAIRAQVMQLVNEAKLERKDAEKPYNFTHKKKIKKIYVTEEQHKQLGKEQLGIIAINNHVFELVPSNVAKKIAERDASFVVSKEATDAVSDSSSKEDDPYAKYEVPDDLTW